MSEGREFTVIIEEDEDGMYIAEVPQLDACYTQARSLDELMARIHEAIELCLETEPQPITRRRLVGVQTVVA